MSGFNSFLVSNLFWFQFFSGSVFCCFKSDSREEREREERPIKMTLRFLRFSILKTSRLLKHVAGQRFFFPSFKVHSHCHDLCHIRVFHSLANFKTKKRKECFRTKKRKECCKSCLTFRLSNQISSRIGSWNS